MSRHGYLSNINITLGLKGYDKTANYKYFESFENCIVYTWVIPIIIDEIYNNTIKKRSDENINNIPDYPYFFALFQIAYLKQRVLTM